MQGRAEKQINDEANALRRRCRDQSSGESKQDLVCVLRQGEEQSKWNLEVIENRNREDCADGS